MHAKNIKNIEQRGGFTLIELITAMAITAILVVVIMQLTNQGIGLWKAVREDTSTAASARMALQSISEDLESIQLRGSGKNTQWLYAEVDSAIRGVPKGLSIPKSARLIFFACPPDRNPAVGATSSMRNNYRNLLAADPDTPGEVSAGCYRLKFRDHILNLPSRNGDTTSFPLFAIYRQVVSPRNTYDNILGSNDLKTSYSQYEPTEDKNFLCENIVEMNVIFNVEYANQGGGSSDQPFYSSISVPVLSSTARGAKRRFQLYGEYADTEGNQLERARIVSAELSITALTEEGVALVEQVRLGQRRPPALEDFFSKYTRSYSRSVPLPQPL